MIDLHFADGKNLRQFNCNQCPETVKRQRKCQSEGFENLMATKQVDEYGIKVNFCPGKSTWFEEAHILFSQCFVAITTGILPKGKCLDDQPANFTDLFPYFVERWEYRRKIRLWTDINDFAGKVFESISKMFGGK